MRLKLLSLVLLAVLPRLVAAQENAKARHGGTVIVLDSLDLRGAGGQTLTAFLAGRVPGLMVAFTTGLESSTPRVVTRGTYGTFAPPEPLLYVDGVLWKDDYHNLGNTSAPWVPAGTGPAPSSVGWGLPIEEVAEVRVHLGASSALMLEDGASRGAVFVTTHRPGSDATIVHASLWTGVREGGALGEPNMGTYGIVAGQTTIECTLALQATGACTLPLGRVTWRPAEQILPFQRARGARASLSATGRIGDWGYRASAVRGVMDGSLPGGHADRTDLGIATSGRWRDAVDVAFDARYALSRGNRIDWDGSAMTAIATSAGPSQDTVWTNLVAQAAGLMSVAPRRESDRFSVGAKATWPVTAATTMEFTASQDLLRRVSHADWGTTWFVDGSPLTTTRESSLYQRDASLAAMAKHTRVLWRTWRVDARGGARFRRIDGDEHYSNISCCVDHPFFPPSFGESAWLGPRAEITTLLAAGRVAFGDRGMLGAGLRQESAYGERLSPTMKSAEGSWDVIAARPDGQRRVLDRLVARFGYGESFDHRMAFQAYAGVGAVRLETSVDREMAVDAAWAGGIETSVTHSVTTVANGMLLDAMLMSPFPSVIAPSAGWRVDAMLVRVAVRSDAGSSVPWRVALSALTRRPVLTDLSVAPYCGVLPGIYLATCTEKGRALGLPVFQGGYTFADVNGDGIITESEVTVGTVMQTGKRPDPSSVISLVGDVALRRGITIGTVIESRLGQKALDQEGLYRCRRRRCAALHDPSTPLAEQAAAVAAGIVSGFADFSGFYHDASFARVREVHVSWSPRLLSGSTVRFAAHQLLVWTRFPAGDPEAMPWRGAVPSGIASHHEGIRPSFSVRIELAAAPR